MLDLYLQAAHTDTPSDESPAQTRDRLKSSFPAGSVRRMTQLGLLIGATLKNLTPSSEDTIVYATGFGESRALESYLDSFPGPSPTLFQTSIHPSGVQQGLIGYQQPIRELFPLAGGADLTAQSLLLAATACSSRILFCGGEERATWLTEKGVASQRTFAFACLLSKEHGDAPLARISLTQNAEAGSFSLSQWCDSLQNRAPIHTQAAEGWLLSLEWFPA